MSRRLLECFQQGVERRVRKHVDFVNDIDPIVAAERRKLHVLTDFPHVVHTGVGSAVNLDHIDRCALSDLQAAGADVTGGRDGTTLAIERLGEDARHRGLADSARSRKQEGVRDSIGCNGVDQGLNHVRLADEILKGARPILSRRDLVVHSSLGVRRHA